MQLKLKVATERLRFEEDEDRLHVRGIVGRLNMPAEEPVRPRRFGGGPKGKAVAPDHEAREPDDREPAGGAPGPPARAQSPRGRIAGSSRMRAKDELHETEAPQGLD